MDANQLLFYLKGFFELTKEPTAAQISAIRNEILNAQPLEPEVITVPVVNPINGKPGSDCGCGSKKKSTYQKPFEFNAGGALSTATTPPGGYSHMLDI